MNDGVAEVVPLGVSAETVDVDKVQRVLRSLGFKLPVSGRWDEVTQSIFRSAVIGLGLQTPEREIEVSPSDDLETVEITPAVLPAMRVVAERRVERRPETLLDMARAVQKTITLAPNIADEIEQLRERGLLTDRISNEYEQWVESGERLLRSFANLILPIDSLMAVIEASGYSREEVEEALLSLPRATGFSGLGSVSAVVIVGVIIAAILAIGFFGFALASGEITQIVAHQSSTFRLLALIAGELLGADSEKVSKAAKTTEPEPPPEGQTTRALVLGGLGVAAVVGGFFIARRLRTRGGLSGSPEAHIATAQTIAEDGVRSAERALERAKRGECDFAMASLRKAIAQRAEARGNLTWSGTQVPKSEQQIVRDALTDITDMVGEANTLFRSKCLKG